MTYREDAVYFAANPNARNGFQTPGTVEYTAEMKVVPMIDWKPLLPADAFKAITAASGIKIFYIPRPTDKPGFAQKLSNASVAFLLREVAEQAGLVISYGADGVHLSPGDPALNTEHSNARMRKELPMPRNLQLEASPEFQMQRQRLLDGENAAMQERKRKASIVNVGDPAPDFTCRTTAGEEFTLSKMKGKVVILQFHVNNQWSWDTIQKFEKEILPAFGTRKDVQMLAVFCNLDEPKLEELLQKKSISHPAAADPKSEISGKYASDYGRTYVIGKDGTIKQWTTGSLVQVPKPAKPGEPPGQMEMALDYTPATMEKLKQVLQSELATRP
jgi:peroxiredoxin